MSEVKEEKQSPQNVPRLWLSPSEPEQRALPQVFVYQPAVAFECFLQFRDFRAEFIHSQERFYTAWLPIGNEDLAVDWGLAAVNDLDPQRLEPALRPAIQRQRNQVKLTNKRMDEIQDDLITYLVRHESLSLLYNPYLRWYSKLGEQRDEFLNRLMDETLTELQPKLKELARRLQLQVEQLRERPLPEDVTEDVLENLETARRRIISALENKMDALIMENSGPLLNPLLDLTSEEIRIPEEIREMKEDLVRIEQEIFHDLNTLVTEHTNKVCECQQYEIKLQPTDARVIRRFLLWIPVISPTDSPQNTPAGG